MSIVSNNNELNEILDIVNNLLSGSGGGLDTSDATAIASDILTGKIAYAKGVKIIGTMKNWGAFNFDVPSKDFTLTVPAGYHNGNGVLRIKQDAVSQLIPENIKSGITILGITGNYTATDGEDTISLQSKSVTPSINKQVIYPDSGYDYLTYVEVAPIPYTVVNNSAGGQTVTIGG